MAYHFGDQSLVMSQRVIVDSKAMLAQRKSNTTKKTKTKIIKTYLFLLCREMSS